MKEARCEQRGALTQDSALYSKPFTLEASRRLSSWQEQLWESFPCQRSCFWAPHPEGWSNLRRERWERDLPFGAARKPSRAVPGCGTAMERFPESSGFQPSGQQLLGLAGECFGSFAPSSFSSWNFKGSARCFSPEARLWPQLCHSTYHASKTKNSVAGFSDLAVIFTSTGSAITLVGSARSVPSATEKEKGTQIRVSRPQELRTAKRARTILGFVPAFHVSKVIDMRVYFADL